jgi:diaminohydroxyphosphoribosylaminopyrimidine deaminase/5-amino-6-(5-phosphoribosylamino)uracil reductase
VKSDEKFMHLALAEARKGLGKTSPNPAVGAVLVRGGQVIACGYHHGAGLPHAEVEALQQVRDGTRATLFVTLEPCSTHGRTPPCVGAIIAAGVRRVVIGTPDPNPNHAGRAVGLLEAAGIPVTRDVLERECRELNPGFNHWIVTKMPYVIAKAGMSLDGRITRAAGEGQWLTSEASRAHARRLRGDVDAILIGGETLRADNPRLTVRGIPGARQPWRVIVSRSGDLPGSAHVFTDEHQHRTLVYTGKRLRAVLRDLGRREVTSVLIEGGMRTLGEAFDQRLVRRVQFYVAPLLLGGPKVAVGGRGAGSTLESPRLLHPRYEQIGDDLILTGETEYAPLSTT